MASVVLVDSEPVVRSVLIRILERAGHAVRATGDFREAIAMLHGASADIVVTNVFLRDISGHDAMKLLRLEFPFIRVLMVSGLPDEKAIAEWEGEPRFSIFPKPFTPDALVAKVTQVLTSTEDAF